MSEALWLFLLSIVIPDSSSNCLISLVPDDSLMSLGTVFETEKQLGVIFYLKVPNGISNGDYLNPISEFEKIERRKERNWTKIRVRAGLLTVLP